MIGISFAHAFTTMASALSVIQGGGIGKHAAGHQRQQTLALARRRKANKAARAARKITRHR